MYYIYLGRSSNTWASTRHRNRKILKLQQKEVLKGTSGKFIKILLIFLPGDHPLELFNSISFYLGCYCPAGNEDRSGILPWPGTSNHKACKRSTLNLYKIIVGKRKLKTLFQ